MKKQFDKKLLITIVVMAAIVIVSAAFLAVYYFGDNSPRELTGSTKVLLKTSMGDITIQLRTDKPITSENFRTLVEEGKYDNTIFHRVVEGFMVQGGQISGSVSTIPDEIGDNNTNVAYTIAMANTGVANSASSQFFINTVDNSNPTFNAKYTVFGYVIDGQDVVDAISHVECGPNEQYGGENSAPLTPVELIKATMLP
jgi:cyclophilin family peptidyl-prolyl cis-trans isomerase